MTEKERGVRGSKMVKREEKKWGGGGRVLGWVG